MCVGVQRRCTLCPTTQCGCTHTYLCIKWSSGCTVPHSQYSVCPRCELRHFRDQVRPYITSTASTPTPLKAVLFKMVQLVFCAGAEVSGSAPDVDQQPDSHHLQPDWSGSAPDVDQQPDSHHLQPEWSGSDPDVDQLPDSHQLQHHSSDSAPDVDQQPDSDGSNTANDPAEPFFHVLPESPQHPEVLALRVLQEACCLGTDATANGPTLVVTHWWLHIEFSLVIKSAS